MPDGGRLLIETRNSIFPDPRAAPKGVPSPIVQKLRAAVLAAMELPSVQERAHKVGTDLVPPDERSSDYLQKYFESEIAKWAKAIKTSGITLD